MFHGAFLAGLLYGLPIEQSARFASAVSAIKCTRIGGRAGIPTREVAERFMESGTIEYEEIDRRVAKYERGIEDV
ncbi:MAG: PfkB family carbohydrate kinase [Lachnospiraceae bacterium]|nr:PfkB family carbohydrate kinase [Lachnospiraceae bacterium]